MFDKISVLSWRMSWMCAIMVALLPLSGCGGEDLDKGPTPEEARALVRETRNDAIVVKTALPDTTVSAKGEVQADGQGGIVWKTPGEARFTIEFPCDELIDPDTIWITFFFKGERGQPVDIGNVQPEAASVDKGQLSLVVTHSVLAKFDTHGQLGLQIEAEVDGEEREIANIPFRGTFE